MSTVAREHYDRLVGHVMKLASGYSALATVIEHGDETAALHLAKMLEAFAYEGLDDLPGCNIGSGET